MFTSTLHSYYWDSSLPLTEKYSHIFLGCSREKKSENNADLNIEKIRSKIIESHLTVPSSKIFILKNFKVMEKPPRWEIFKTAVKKAIEEKVT